MQTEWWRLKWDKTELGMYSVANLRVAHWLPLQHKHNPKMEPEMDEEEQNEERLLKERLES